ncbi:hypothetical protein EQ500_04355, partial [Lactobacillus sp. XV13L]|nr:hypothetical protein [Lactobacillus sp. XV13L]
AQTQQDKIENINGVVTVKSNIASAHLYTPKGELIADRTLTANSNWRTDRKLTLADGRVLYRVSTSEYILASQVDYNSAAAAVAPSATTITGDVAVSKLAAGSIVHVNGRAQETTSLWSKANNNGSMSLIADRNLSGNSDWQTDQKATVNGVTFYRVSTNEWINAKYVTLKPGA